MSKASSVSSFTISADCINTISANVSKIKARANYAFAHGEDFQFPSVVEILGVPPTLPSNSNIKHMLETSKKLSTYYNMAAYIEGDFAKICKKKRA